MLLIVGSFGWGTPANIQSIRRLAMWKHFGCSPLMSSWTLAFNAPEMVTISKLAPGQCGNMTRYCLYFVFIKISLLLVLQVNPELLQAGWNTKFLACDFPFWTCLEPCCAYWIPRRICGLGSNEWQMFHPGFVVIVPDVGRTKALHLLVLRLQLDAAWCRLHVTMVRFHVWTGAVAILIYLQNLHLYIYIYIYTYIHIYI